MTGIYTVILERIFQNMPDYKVKLTPVPWKRGLKMAKQGKLLALYPPYARPVERPYMDYDMAILDEELAVFCRNEVLTKPRPNWPEDYYGLDIGNNAGFLAGGDAFWAAVKDKKISVQETKGTPRNLLKLIAGRVDCYMNDSLSIRWELKKLQSEGKYDGSSLSKGAVISKEQGFLGFSKVSNDFPYKKDFKSKYLQILKELKASGEIDRIVDKYLQ
ncbi:ABC transporter substrate-binding protein [Litoribacillus peritrichatus]|uniref:ABC transporter substrate-binding protein n=2 Tax=Litoribacillus peritrichatus TaxID=718191 RepID=A0ABP7M7J7_9GAMM